MPARRHSATWSGWKCPTRWYLVGREGLNVGKVAKRKISNRSARKQNALTCRYVLVKIVVNNVLQLFRHLGANFAVLGPAAGGIVQLFRHLGASGGVLRSARTLFCNSAEQ